MSCSSWCKTPTVWSTKEELLQAVWGDTFVEEGNLDAVRLLFTQGAG